MRVISMTPRTLDFSIAPCMTRDVRAGCGVHAVGRDESAGAVFLQLPRLREAHEAQFAALRVGLVLAPSRTLMVPSGLIEMSRSVGWNVIGPPSPSTW